MSPDIQRRSKQYLLFRLLIIVIGFGLVTFYQVWLEAMFPRSTFRYLYALLGLYFVLGAAACVSHARWGSRPEIMRWQVLGDFVIQSLLVWGTGGVISIFSPLLFVTLVAATSIISARGAFLLATLATVLLTASTVIYGLGIAPYRLGTGEAVRGSETPHFIVSYLVASVLALYAISTLGSRFSHGLRQVEGIHGEIIESMAEGLIALDRDERVVQLNREARKLLGLPPGCGGGLNGDLDDLFPGERYCALRQAFRDNRRRRIRTVVGGPDAVERHVEVKISSVEDARGSARCRVALLSDLTLKRSAEAAERRIQKLEDLREMAMGIAHEIRNPLASIRGCVQEIGRLMRAAGAESGNAGRFMEIVCRESDRLDAIIEEFLLYARSGRSELSAVDLAALVEEVAVLLRSRPDFGGRTLEVAAAARPRILGDRNQLIQVFLNLGINALEATSPVTGCITVSIRAKSFPALDSRSEEVELVPGVEVEVADNGKGMGDGELRKLFTPFFTTKETGNGLGLCIADRIVREHMGLIDVSSVPGRGASFRLGFTVLPEAAETKVQMGEEDQKRTELYSHA